IAEGLVGELLQGHHLVPRHQIERVPRLAVERNAFADGILARIFCRSARHLHSFTALNPGALAPGGPSRSAHPRLSGVRPGSAFLLPYGYLFHSGAPPLSVDPALAVCLRSSVRLLEIDLKETQRS